VDGVDVNYSYLNHAVNLSSLSIIMAHPEPDLLGNLLRFIATHLTLTHFKLEISEYYRNDNALIESVYSKIIDAVYENPSITELTFELHLQSSNHTEAEGIIQKLALTTLRLRDRDLVVNGFPVERFEELLVPLPPQFRFAFDDFNPFVQFSPNDGIEVLYS
jgi:hypothetical protein